MIVKVFFWGKVTMIQFINKGNSLFRRKYLFAVTYKCINLSERYR